MSGVFGAFSHSGKPILEDVYLGLFALQHRGRLSAGAAWINEGRVNMEKGEGLVHEVLDQKYLAMVDAHAAIGHVRGASKEGGPLPDDAQPLGVTYAQGSVAIAHDGRFTNARGLVSYLENTGAIFHTSSDTEIILHLMAHCPGRAPLEAFEEALTKVKGAYSIAVIFGGSIVAARDPWGFKPLILGEKDDTTYIASESCALDILGAKIIRDVKPGEVVIIDNRGIISQRLPVEVHRSAHCSFEYIYLARPDSVIDGKSVYSVRKAFGRKLFKGDVHGGAVVTGMPDSGTVAALGYAEASSNTYEAGVVRNRYVDCSFAEATERVREAGVKIKLNPQPEIFKDKDAVVIDDSLLRGTTAARVVSMLRESGAEHVYVKIACPPMISPCYYGVGTPGLDELIAARMDEKSICREIGADSLSYLSCGELAEAIGMPKCDLCMACFGSNNDENEDLEEFLAI